MSCLYPVKCYRARMPNSEGKRPLFHNVQDAIRFTKNDYFLTSRKCGSCTNCRLEHSRQIAVRCMHEAQMHKQNSFITLTYNDENLPSDRSATTDEIQRFWKRLRKRGVQLKYYAVSEYGDAKGERTRTLSCGKIVGDNPHFHAIVFGYDFPDKKYLKTVNGNRLYTSAFLEDVWGNGHCPIGDVTFESAAYVARYTLKKQYGKKAENYYDGRQPETSWSSQNFAKSWFDKYGLSVYDYDELIIRGGHRCKPPPYYDKMLQSEHPYLFDIVKEKREVEKNKINSKINFDMSFDYGTQLSRCVSDIVKTAQMTTHKLDYRR